MQSRCRRYRAALPFAVLAVATVLAACGADEPGVAPAGEPGSPTELRAELRQLEAQANQLLDGGPRAFRDRLARLRGAPVVVNQWASWCDPCRFEFPFFERQAKKHRGTVAFLGVDSQDSRDDAEEFLQEFPVPFPHFYDKDASIARLFDGGRAWPTTAFYNADGKLTKTHLGAYATEAKLEADIRRYALDG
jgi:cytochrome c biogenesis protein CcmG, thiol:disulfide interchange protein DsbE